MSENAHNFDPDDIADDDEFLVHDVNVLCSTMLAFIENDRQFPLSKYMSLEQMKQLLVKEFNLGDESCVVISLRKLMAFQEAICDMVLGRMLSGLAAEGILEVAWDEESNEPMFSLAKDHEAKLQMYKDQTEQPEDKNP